MFWLVVTVPHQTAFLHFYQKPVASCLFTVYRLQKYKKKVSHFLFVFKMFSYQRDLGNLTKRCFWTTFGSPKSILVNSKLYFQECRDFKIKVKEVIFRYWHLINVCPEKNTFRVSCGDWCALQHNTMVDLAVIQTDWAPGKVKPLL